MLAELLLEVAHDIGHLAYKDLLRVACQEGRRGYLRLHRELVPYVAAATCCWRNLQQTVTLIATLLLQYGQITQASAALVDWELLAIFAHRQHPSQRTHISL